MVYAAVLAGGGGNRIKSLNYPKQFYEINNKPIIIYTIEKLVYSDKIDLVYVAVISDYLVQTKKLIKKYNLEKKTIVIPGGTDRMGTIDNVTKAITASHEINKEDIILIHDAVRPFITNKIIDDSIEGTKEYGATVAAIPAIDTIVHSDDKEIVDSIPARQELFCGQSPDTFKLQEFLKMQANLTPLQKQQATGTSQVCTFNNKKIHMIKGDPINFKITTDLDLLIASKIVEEGLYESSNCNTKKSKSLKFKSRW